MLKKLVQVFWLIILTLSLVSVGLADTPVSGNISEDTTWDIADSPYIVTADVTVLVDVTLTIEPGVVVKFNSGTQITTKGTLHAVGEETNLIRFTSPKDIPSAGDWDGICFDGTPSSDSVMQYCEVLYAKQAYSSTCGWLYGAIGICHASPTITNSTIRNSYYAGIYTKVLYVTDSNGAEISHNTIRSNNSYPITIGGNVRIDFAVLAARIHDNTYEANSPNAIALQDVTLEGDYTWSTLDGLPLELGGMFTLPNAYNLTIPAGSEIRSNGGSGFSISGNLQAIGTDSQKITFTTANRSNPQPGQWNGIDIIGTDSSASRLEHCIIKYANTAILIDNVSSPEISHCDVINNSANGIEIYDLSEPTIANCSVKHNGNQGVYCYKSTPTITDSEIAHCSSTGITIVDPAFMPTISGSIIEANGWALYIKSGNLNPIDLGNISGNDFLLNSPNVVGWESITLVDDYTWGTVDGLPIRIVNGDLTIPTDVTVTMNPGDVVKFGGGCQITVKGVLHAVGEETNPIRFTSPKDIPSAGDWDGICFDGTPSSDSVMQYCEVLYAKQVYSPTCGWLYGAIGICHASPTITKSIIRNNYHAGIFIRGSYTDSSTSEPTIDGCAIRSNKGGIIAYTALPWVGNCSIANNTDYGLHNDGVQYVDARNNWWGHESGPQHPDNPDGQGQLIQGNVTFDPWSTVEPPDPMKHPGRYERGDVSGDGAISAYDAALILQYVVGIITEFPYTLLSTSGQVVPKDYTIAMPKLRVMPGEKVRVPIMMEESLELQAGGIVVKYDTSALRAVDVTPSSLLSGYFWKHHFTESQVRMAFAGVQPPKRSGEIFYIEFEVVGGVEGDEIPLILESVDVVDGLTITKKHGSIEILPKETVLLPNYPNPFNPETWLPYRLSQDAMVRINIYNSTGQRVRVLDVGQQHAGSYVSRTKAARWDGRDRLGQKVASGVYFYTLKVREIIPNLGTREFSSTRRMVIMK